MRAAVRRAAAVAGWLALAGCDQFARIGIAAPAVRDSGPPAASERDADVATPSDAGPLDAGAALADAGSADAGEDATMQCPNVQIAVCDPVKNLGCSSALMQQCAIDYLGNLTGYCIFQAPPRSVLGGDCLNTGVTESCPPTSTCYAARCQRIGLCDADCDAGQCCTGAIESTGFRVCGDC